MVFARYPSLSDRVVFVTGGASGIGAEIVRAFTANGSRVAFLDIQGDTGEVLASELSDADHPPLFLRCDIVDIDTLRGAITETRARLGPIGVLVNNAANDERRKVDEVTIDYWDQVQAINLRPQFFAAQAVRSQMRELSYGSIINFSSIAWRSGATDMVSCGTANSAVIGMTRALARSFGADNIRVNAIEPGAVMTERQRRLWYQTDESVERIVSRQSIKSLLLPDEIARTVLFLAADDSRMITKQSIIVDAGLS